MANRKAPNTPQGRTALHLAAISGHPQLVAVLLKGLAGTPSSTGMAPSTSSGSGGGGGTGVGGQGTDAAPSQGQAEASPLGQLLEARDAQGHTALHLAAARGHWRVVEELWPRWVLHGCTWLVRT